MKVSSKRGFVAMWLVALLTLSLLLVACGDNTSTSSSGTCSSPAVTTLSAGNAPPITCLTGTKLPDGLQYIDLITGTGAAATTGKTVTVNYTGWIAPGGPKFDSSLDHGQPFPFPLGGGQVIQGWDEGVVGMKVGGLRRLIIPAALGYGAQGFPPTIPANATLIFDVQLLNVA